MRQLGFTVALALGLLAALASAASCGRGSASSSVASGANGAASAASSAPPSAASSPSADGSAQAAGSSASAARGPSAAPADASPSGCSIEASEPLVRQVERKRFEQDLAFVARAPRPPGSPHWQAVQSALGTRLEELGFEVERQRYATGVNIVGRRPGTLRRDEQVLVSAHYDHVAACLGADDNASGVAGALEVARVLGSARFSRTLVVAFWDEEELGLLGSQAYAARAAARGDRIVVSYVYEMIGYRNATPGSQRIPVGFELVFPAEIAKIKARDSRGDFLFVVADEAARAPAECLQAHAAALGLPMARLELGALRKRAELFRQLQRSDHARFWERDIPAMMLTDTADFRNAHYHCGSGPDATSDLDPEFATLIIKATVGSAAAALGPP